MDKFQSVDQLDGLIASCLKNMAIVAEQLRVQGYNTEANKIGQLSVQLVNEFRDTSIQLRERNVKTSHPLAIIANGPIKQKTATVEVDLDYPTQQHSPCSDEFQLHNSNTWARVVAEKPSVHNTGRATVRVGRGAKPISNGHNGHPSRPLHRSKSLKEGAEVHVNNRHDDTVLEFGKAGVVTIEGPVKNTPRFLSYVAVRIHEGPVYDLSIVGDCKAIVVFQYALHAQIFVDRNTESQATRGESIFGGGDWTVKLEPPMNWTDTLKRMGHPHRERRRLTFVRSKLFADQASYHKWIREVEDVAGVGNVDFVWAFNTGNATAVFFSVAVARKVMQTFSNWRHNRGCYEDLAVTYSTDPCEKDLQLTTQLRYFVQPAHRTFEQQYPGGDENHPTAKRANSVLKASHTAAVIIQRKLIQLEPRESPKTGKLGNASHERLKRIKFEDDQEKTFPLSHLDRVVAPPSALGTSRQLGCKAQHELSRPLQAGDTTTVDMNIIICPTSLRHASTTQEFQDNSSKHESAGC
ncbi:hypothetical protein PISL3812_07246 [Talaromyces islandicus]|uniref:Uncharacterized protein n=1 Tax=Talaromyces islandicus TaxID=28573 RepID=A0A0U1M3M4_TALIS|nr:hypothetical protein PISL3812_07246 [Talaromyces islandicus]